MADAPRTPYDGPWKSRPCDDGATKRGDPTVFLAAYCDEVEAVAKAAAGPDWLEDNSPSLVVFTRQQADGARLGVRGIAWCSNGYDSDHANMVHIALHDPALALRQVTAVRAILARYKRAVATPESVSAFVRGQDDGYRQACFDAIEDFAAVFSDRPSYDLPETRGGEPA
jgi:hypothetical protein